MIFLRSFILNVAITGYVDLWGATFNWSGNKVIALNIVLCIAAGGILSTWLVKGKRA